MGVLASWMIILANSDGVHDARATLVERQIGAVAARMSVPGNSDDVL